MSSMSGDTEVKIDIGLVAHVNHKLKKCALNPRYCLKRFKIGNESYRSMPTYTDPKNYPAYYYISCHIHPRNILEIGFKTGLEGGCLLAGCGRSVHYYFGFHKKTKDYWSSRISRSNIANMLGKKADYWDGDITDSEFLKKFLSHQWDCILINEITDETRYREYLDLAWSRLSYNGIVIMDNVTNLDNARKVYFTYCEITKKKPNIINSRNGIGILIK